MPCGSAELAGHVPLFGRDSICLNRLGGFAMQAKEEKEEKIADEPTWQELGQAKYVNLGTWRKSGVCVNTPVWGAPLNGAMYAFSELKAGKVKRLRNSARSRLAV